MKGEENIDGKFILIIMDMSLYLHVAWHFNGYACLI